ncbi:MAG TPA: hypothetical protein VFE36_02895 [Candidatus Baltobacteraceae bacterium]|nr:hypothetical protein [Candidatus Baltobacteraceae bacterium]
MAERYELVLQFALAPRDVARFDRITEFENRLEHRCSESADDGLYTVDGSDCKLGHMEVRLITSDPPRTLEVIRGMIPASCPYDAGYRNAHTQESLTGL